MTATQVSRNFSDVLDRVAAGEEIEVTRRGAPVALISSPARFLSADRFRELIATAPSPDEAFAEDLRDLRESAGAPGDPWPA